MKGERKELEEGGLAYLCYSKTGVKREKKVGRLLDQQFDRKENQGGKVGDESQMERGKEREGREGKGKGREIREEE